MRFVSTALHAFFDYPVAFLLIVMPLGEISRGSEVLVSVTIGVLLLLTNLMTDYEIRLSPRIPMRFHARIDGILGGLLAGSPWIFSFDDIVWLPHVIAGFVIVWGASTVQIHNGLAFNSLNNVDRRS